VDEEKIKEYYQITDMLAVSNYALKWINLNKNANIESIITLNEKLLHELIKFGLNNIGLIDE